MSSVHRLVRTVDECNQLHDDQRNSSSNHGEKGLLTILSCTLWDHCLCCTDSSSSKAVRTCWRWAVPAGLSFIHASFMFSNTVQVPGTNPSVENNSITSSMEGDSMVNIVQNISKYSSSWSKNIERNWSRHFDSGIFTEKAELNLLVVEIWHNKVAYWSRQKDRVDCEIGTRPRWNIGIQIVATEIIIERWGYSLRPSLRDSLLTCRTAGGEWVRWTCKVPMPKFANDRAAPLLPRSYWVQ